MINLNNFIEKYNNQSIDIDNAYGIQCYDLAALWIIQNQWGNGFYCGWTGGVRDLAEHFDEISGIDRSKVEFIRNDPNNSNQIPRAGDIVIFGSSWGQGFGHIGICISANQEYMRTFEQNIGNGDAIGYDDRTQIVERRLYNDLLGWVREKEIKIDQEIMFKNSLKEAIQNSPYSYEERTKVIQGAVDNNDGNYIVAEMEMAWDKEIKLTNLLQQNASIILANQKELENVKNELDLLKIEHKKCKSSIDPVLETPNKTAIDIAKDIKEELKTTNIDINKFSFNKFMIGLSKSGQLQIILSIITTSLIGATAKYGLNVSEDQVLTIMGAVFTLFGINISVATNNNTQK